MLTLIFMFGVVLLILCLCHSFIVKPLWRWLHKEDGDAG
jgi:hypothetical protein